MRAAGATPSQVNTWQKQNASAFALQQQRAEAMVVAWGMRTQAVSGEARIPAGASPTLKDYLVTQAALAKSRANIHNQLVQQATPSGQSLTFVQYSALRQNEDRLFRQQNATLLSLQQQRMQELASASAQIVHPIPAAVVIPAGTSPEKAAYLTNRNALNRSMIQLQNQYAAADPSVRSAALSAWFKQNGQQLSQLQQEQAQFLSTAGTNQ